MYYPSFSDFKVLAQRGNLIPVYKELLADEETPVSAFRKIDDGRHSFLLESVEGGEKWARYSFLGTGPSTVFKVTWEHIIMEQCSNLTVLPHRGDPLSFLRNIMTAYHPAGGADLPRFYGGAVGFLGYEMIDYFEKLPERKKESLCEEEAVFLLTDHLLIFDNQKHTIKVVAHTTIGEEEDLETIYQTAVQKIEKVIEKLKNNIDQDNSSPKPGRIDLRPTVTPEEFLRSVAKAKKYIEEGDIIQVVLSRRFEANMVADEFDIYRALRFINPSPYMFFLRLQGLTLVGSSPEVLVRSTDGLLELRPIAGTRKRGRSESEDRQLAHDLLNDPKEKAEHVMLVDLGRNDLGRIARTGSVQVNELMVVERYSHVMHLVSHIQAYLEKNKDAFDVLKSTFPAGTLTGAPKIRAMEIIRELEPENRGPYGGAVGYFGFNGNLDMGITIRTIVIKGEKMYLQAGAGIVADSDPQRELEEVDNKIKGMVRALELAAGGLELA